ncbi:uncharacterized sulfatase [Mariniphaga anaerophila]|uniref:Uncharacterized sulfatase n=1 Tax=Mariniphaga anaerophila TaxID=1484053 RepID=A0A1M5DLP5_9BACT|nr:sulfatase [Mariniphaga anaerophila]SHF67692.1 uncharacterized sulfatase [Mariniphaga anaerophila]
MFGKTILVFLLIGLMCEPVFAADKKEQLPNILVFVADDCTYRDLGCYGSTDSKTPTIDSFAKEGVLFTKCFQAVAMCSPTRSNLYTGIYPVKSGAYPNHTFVKEGVKSIVQHLAPQGYRTALLGKKHVNPPSAFPFEFLGDPGDELDFDPMDNFLNEAGANENPFCLFVCSHQPHTPYNQGDPSLFSAGEIQLPPYFVDTEVTRDEFVKYLAEVNYMDSEFRTCLDLLDKYKLSENTLVIFTSEQGNSFPFAKWTCYGSGLQSAFVARWPGKIKAGAETDAMIEYVDVVPTLIEVSGQHVPGFLDGKSFLPVLTGEKDSHKEYVFGIQTTRGIKLGSDYYGIRTIRSERFRYVLNLTPEATFQNNVIADDNKNRVFKSWLTKGAVDAGARELAYKYQHRPAEELYLLDVDPFEMNNVADDEKYADVKKDLRERLLHWMEEQGDKGQQTELEAPDHQWRNYRE